MRKKYCIDPSLKYSVIYTILVLFLARSAEQKITSSSKFGCKNSRGEFVDWTISLRIGKTSFPREYLSIDSNNSSFVLGKEQNVLGSILDQINLSSKTTVLWND
jgi:hypothetical protein